MTDSDHKLIMHTIERMNIFLDGPTGYPERGAITRIDRLEQESKSQKKWLGWTASAALTAIGVAIVKFFTG